MTQRMVRVTRARRPWRVLAAPPPRDFDTIIEEISSDLGLELYMVVRQAWLAAGGLGTPHRPLFTRPTPRHVGERRVEAIHEAPASLRGPVRTLMRLTGRRPPSMAEVARACELIADWGMNRGFATVALHFAEAAAAVQPEEAYWAFLAGRTNRLVGDEWRAEVFYARAIRAAYRSLNWDIYVRAHLGYARLQADRGRPRAAVRHLTSAARVALDQGRDWLAAQIYHDLISYYYELGDIGLAHKEARRALCTYPRHHERFPIALHDLALLLAFENQYHEAWDLLQTLMAAPLRPHDEVLIWGTVARAAGSLSLAKEYSIAERRVLELAPLYPAFAAAAYLGLAAGAFAIGEQSVALRYAEDAERIAELRKDRQTLRLVRELLLQIRGGTTPAQPAPRLTGEPAHQLAELAEQMAELVRTWRAETWTMKENQRGLDDVGPV